MGVIARGTACNLKWQPNDLNPSARLFTLTATIAAATPSLAQRAATPPPQSMPPAVLNCAGERWELLSPLYIEILYFTGMLLRPPPPPPPPSSSPPTQLRSFQSPFKDGMVAVAGGDFLAVLRTGCRLLNHMLLPFFYVQNIWSNERKFVLYCYFRRWFVVGIILYKK